MVCGAFHTTKAVLSEVCAADRLNCRFVGIEQCLRTYLSAMDPKGDQARGALVAKPVSGACRDGCI